VGWRKAGRLGRATGRPLEPPQADGSADLGGFEEALPQEQHPPEAVELRRPEERALLRLRIRRAAKARKVALPDPDEFVELMARVRKTKR
jgi:hypothetical protein